MNIDIFREDILLNSDMQDFEERTPCQDEKHQKGLAPEKGPEYGKPRASSYKCTAKKPSKCHLEFRRELMCRYYLRQHSFMAGLDIIYAEGSSLLQPVSFGHQKKNMGRVNQSYYVCDITSEKVSSWYHTANTSVLQHASAPVSLTVGFEILFSLSSKAASIAAR